MRRIASRLDLRLTPRFEMCESAMCAERKPIGRADRENKNRQSLPRSSLCVIANRHQIASHVAASPLGRYNRLDLHHDVT